MTKFILRWAINAIRVISGGTDPAGHRPEKQPHFDPLACTHLWSGQCAVPPLDLTADLSIDHAHAGLIHTL